MVNVTNNVVDEIFNHLSKAENGLRDVIAQAAGAGDYRGVDIAKNVAVQLSDIMQRLKTPTTNRSIELPKNEHTLKREESKASNRKKDYPKFEVRNSSISRIGWSKKEKCEYTHKVPVIVFERTVEAMDSLSKSGAGPFTAEEIINKANEMQTEPVPSYQVYVVIGLLRENNCVKQVGREGYYFSSDISEKARMLLQNL
jgi:hypothetical protein